MVQNIRPGFFAERCRGVWLATSIITRERRSNDAVAYLDNRRTNGRCIKRTHPWRHESKERRRPSNWSHSLTWSNLRRFDRSLLKRARRRGWTGLYCFTQTATVSSTNGVLEKLKEICEMSFCKNAYRWWGCVDRRYRPRQFQWAKLRLYRLYQLHWWYNFTNNIARRRGGGYKIN